MDDLPGGDILFHTGDFTEIGERDQVEDFIEWLSGQDYQHKIFIAGNHDLTLASERLAMVKWDWHRNGVHHKQSEYLSLGNVRPGWVDNMLANLPSGVTYLQDSGTKVLGLNVWGTPWSPTFGTMWAFNADPHALQQAWALIPSDTDVLLTHTPPFGFGDRVSNGTRVGCEHLTRTINELGPCIHLCGHIHEDFGYRVMGNTRDTVTVNSSMPGDDLGRGRHDIEINNNGVYTVSLSSTQ